ncbi:PucC family protein [Roseobacter litoralis]|uniref:Protein PucC n=1 Tax=Roseobacter litoralis (strain ATCC 49566 / DSM 6996 / JCM 21268 / NBRC 15278 / OCh 149) TaxID=391595 RepID=F7ZDG8_ROSLO|nr:PucC family protein [Roseobacter litoralis]AEI94570.1 protein PucC [Roseobacter litoralis Och 149]
MFEYRAFALRKLVSVAPRYLPFADVATEEVPLSRLLRLSLFQVTVGMAIVLLVGTLNRVMIVELSVPATLVAMMLALPLLFAPFRTLIGYKSDVNVSALGLRRVPFIWKGTLYQFGGFAIMPFALLVLSGYGEAVDAPRWMGLSAAALAFLLVGAGVHMVQTVGLALATDLVADEDQPKVVGLMYVMLLVGMVLSALVFGTLLENYSPGRLIQVIQGAAVVTVALNLLALWKQEARDRVRAQKMQTAQHAPFRETLAELVKKPGRKRLLVVIALGTFGFGAADVLLEPYGAQALGFSVAETTRLTALLAGGTLIGFGIASRVLSTNGAPTRLGLIGALIGIPGFSGIILSAFGGGAPLFLAGTLATGIGAGLFGHATLTATMRSAERDQVGLALGTWGAVQATAAGVGVALAGIVRDVIVNMSAYTDLPAHAPYNAVFLIEIVFLALACATLIPLCGKANSTQHPNIHQPKRSMPDSHPKSAEAS